MELSREVNVDQEDCSSSLVCVFCIRSQFRERAPTQLGVPCAAGCPVARDERWRGAAVCAYRRRRSALWLSPKQQLLLLDRLDGARRGAANRARGNQAISRFQTGGLQRD